MTESNKRNLLYFEAPTMRQLYQDMEKWQHEHEKRLLSMSINKDGDLYCCIALTNPSEVVLVNADYRGAATVDNRGALKVRTYPPD